MKKRNLLAAALLITSLGVTSCASDEEKREKEQRMEETVEAELPAAKQARANVILDQAFQATMVSTISSPPVKPVIIRGVTVAQIDNLFIVSPPPAVTIAVDESTRTENDASNILTADFLEFTELEKDSIGIFDYVVQEKEPN